MREDDAVRLRHMLDAAHHALRFVQGRTRGDLDHDRQLVFALVKAIEIIGEAAYRTSPAGRAKVPELPWEDMVAMRHRLVHAYFDIDLDILWKTTQDDIPPLVAALERIAPDDRG